MWWRDTEEGGLGVRARGRCFFRRSGSCGVQAEEHVRWARMRFGLDIGVVGEGIGTRFDGWDRRRMVGRGTHNFDAGGTSTVALRWRRRTGIAGAVGRENKEFARGPKAAVCGTERERKEEKGEGESRCAQTTMRVYV